MKDETKADKTEYPSWPGDVFRCDKCSCEVRVLKKGAGELTCCGQAMAKVAGLNPALSF